MRNLVKRIKSSYLWVIIAVLRGSLCIVYNAIIVHLWNSAFVCYEETIGEIVRDYLSDKKWSHKSNPNLTSETSARTLQPYNILVAHKPITTLWQLLTNVKEKDEPNDRQGAVYNNNSLFLLL